jgi:hypothetical protein
LRSEEQLRDLGELADAPDLSNERIRALIGTPSFVLAEGLAEIFDYDRFIRYVGKINEMNRFFGQITESNLRNTPEYQAASTMVQVAKDAAEREKNPETKGRKRKEAKDAENALESSITQKLDPVADYLIEGYRLITETMMPHRLNLRIFPFQRNPEFSILANLKRDCFVDSDLENIMFAYGMLPSVSLTLFGLVTDLPPKDGRVFNPADVLTSLTSGQRQLEQGFWQVFKSLEELEIHTRFSVYPSVTLYPIAVYQRLAHSDRTQATKT